MAQEDAGRPLHSSGTDGWQSSAPASRSTQGYGSPSKERRPTNSTYKNGDGTEFPRYFLQIGQDIKRTRGYDIIQELQLMVCSKETGVKGNAARARVMVLLREVQGVLVGLENKVDAQTYDLGVFNVERSELRKELRDQKAKEFQPLHTIDFRSTEVKDLPHKLRTLFEDNQVLREQVRQLQYSVRSAETRLEASERRAAALETENVQLGIALREAGSSVDIAHDMRQMREAARNADARAMQLEMQLMAITEQLESERRLTLQKARHAAAKQSMLESRLAQALSVGTPGSGAGAAGGRLGGGGGSATVRKSSARPVVYDPMGMDDGGSFSGRGGDIMCGNGGGSIYGASSVLDGGAGGAAAAAAAFDGRSSAHSRVHSTASAGIAGRTSAGRERSISPPRSPSGRSISHSPGSGIPALYPLFNAKPRPIHAFAADSASWLAGTNPGSVTSGTAGGSSSGAVAGPSGGLPPPPSLIRNASLTDRPAGHGGPMGRPSSGSLAHGSAVAAVAGTMDVLQEGRPPSSTSTSTSSPGELVRAINSAAVVTSRALLPSVSGASAASAGRAGAPGILGLRVGSMAGGAGFGMLRRSTGSDDLSLGPAAAASRSTSGAAAGAGGEVAIHDLGGRTGSSNTAAGEEPRRAVSGGVPGEAEGSLERERWSAEETTL
ncbi:hypothetical protein Vretimale_12409 [Volvox reticuliferus]|uniref:Uncharacterized protein n=1 Tax=Volvox reticuliferus TaxID=1737510 RepID=A0A8J4FK74_9CHLO|nr:hypothetical protein Vretifemale_9075 [Volvox reticuliferus]GIM08387.1 hypothetical protein Vretimale_12409 [Volvox reticuliferus]